MTRPRVLRDLKEHRERYQKSDESNFENKMYRNKQIGEVKKRKESGEPSVKT